MSTKANATIEDLYRVPDNQKAEIISHLLPAKAGSLRLNPNAGGIRLDTIGRMTLAGYETTAHQQQTAQARVIDRGDRSPPCHCWYE